MGLGEELQRLNFGENLADSLAKIGQVIRERKQTQDVKQLMHDATGVDLNTDEGVTQFRQTLLGLGELGEPGRQAASTLVGAATVPLELQQRIEARQQEKFKTDVQPYEESMRQYEQNRRSSTDPKDLQSQYVQLRNAYLALSARYPKQKELIPTPSLPTPIREAIRLSDVNKLPYPVQADVINKYLEQSGLNTRVTPDDMQTYSRLSTSGNDHINTTFSTDKDGKLWVISHREPIGGGAGTTTVEPVIFTDDQGQQQQLTKDTKGEVTLSNLLQAARQLQTQLDNYNQTIPKQGKDETDEQYQARRDAGKLSIQNQLGVLNEFIRKQVVGANDVNETFKTLKRQIQAQNPTWDTKQISDSAYQMMQQWGIVNQNK